MGLRKWFQQQQQKSRDSQFTAGYDYAAGALLRGDKTPLSLGSEFVWEYRSNFDVGMQIAIENAIELGMVNDDRI